MVAFRRVSFLFDFAITSENAKNTTNDAFQGKKAILKHPKTAFDGHKIPYFPRSFPMDVRPKDAWSYVQRGLVVRPQNL